MNDDGIVERQYEKNENARFLVSRKHQGGHISIALTSEVINKSRFHKPQHWNPIT